MGSAGIPVLETERLVLRQPKVEDFDTVGPYLGSERARFIGGPYGRDRAWEAFAATVGAWILQDFGYWAVEERASGRLVGAVGVQHPATFPEDELGWDLFDGFEGQGYATEAARAARAWALGPRGLPTLVSDIDPRNARSMRVAERLGATRDERAARPEGDDCLVYRHPAPEAVQ